MISKYKRYIVTGKAPSALATARRLGLNEKDAKEVVKFAKDLMESEMGSKKTKKTPKS